MKIFKKFILLSMVFVLCFFSATACNKKGEGDFTIWAPLHNNFASVGVTSFSEIESFKRLEEQTGVKIAWENPSMIDINNAYVNMSGRKTLPDAFYYDITKIYDYKKDNMIVDLTDYIEQYGPNIKKTIEIYPELKKQLYDDEGRIWYIPNIRNNVEVDGGIYYGYSVRQDWMAQANIKTMPKNASEWLTAFRALKAVADSKGAGYYVVGGVGSGGGAWYNLISLFYYTFGVSNDFQIKDGQIQACINDSAYKEAVYFAYQLFSEGIIDPDYYTNEETVFENKVKSGKIGFVVSNNHLMQNVWKDANGNNLNFVPVPYLKKDDNAKIYVNGAQYFNYVGPQGLFVTESCKDIKGFIQWVDKQFEIKGAELILYGEEGVDFDYKTIADKKLPYLKKHLSGSISRYKVAVGQGNEWPSARFDFKKEDLFDANWGDKQDVYQTVLEHRSQIDTSQTFVFNFFSLTKEEFDLDKNNLTGFNISLNREVGDIIRGTKGIMTSANDVEAKLVDIRKDLKNSYKLDELVEMYNNAYQRYLARVN